jgi:hypothetical protein
MILLAELSTHLFIMELEVQVDQLYPDVRVNRIPEADTFSFQWEANRRCRGGPAEVVEQIVFERWLSLFCYKSKS